jgi:hypothetical protein
MQTQLMQTQVMQTQVMQTQLMGNTSHGQNTSYGQTQVMGKHKTTAQGMSWGNNGYEESMQCSNSG